MRYFLENDFLKAEVESFGAEVKSVQRKQQDGTWQEYMWEADPAYWGKTSPILFPFIGKLAGESFRYQGQTYPATKHGFARDMDFTVTLNEKERLVLALQSTEDTLVSYPFPFVLEVSYTLEEDSLSVQWSVKNTGETTMYFSMGGHPAFACPLKPQGGNRRDCRVRLYGTGAEGSQIPSSQIDISCGLTSGEKIAVPLEQGEITVTEHIFDQDALVLEEQGIEAVGFVDSQGREYVRMEADCPVWGIWSMPDNGASYICIEPWWGICDSHDYQGSLEERPHTNQAQPGECWEKGYRVIFYPVQ